MKQGKISNIIKNSENIKETLEKIQELDGSKIEKFEDYYKAYQADKLNHGFPLNAWHFEGKLAVAGATLQDVETASNWYELSKELSTLTIDSSKINSLTVKSAVLIIEQAWQNLTQDGNEKESQKNDEQDHTQQSQRRQRQSC